MTTKKAALVSLQKGDEDWDEKPGTILITEDNFGRVYFEYGELSMAVDLADLMDAIKTQICGGNS
jgi:hypothetical protein